MTESLKLFNVFGMATVKQTGIALLATSVLPNGASIEKTLSRSFNPPLAGLGPDQSCTILFAANVDGEHCTEIAVQQISKRIGGPDLFHEQAVQQAIKDVVGKIQMATPASSG